MTGQAATRPWYVQMRARRTDEAHRASTPLELLFDLCFVVAIAQAAAGLDHAVIENHASSGVLTYLLMFFAIWWAWMNFTWFASAYDTDDVPYRLTVMVQICGALVMAAGIPQVFDGGSSNVIVIGYVIMRLAMVTQWLRAASSDASHRTTALRYAAGIAIVQLGWLLLLLVPSQWFVVGFLALVVAELAVPPLAERAAVTTYHRHHIAERYGLFTVIVLGESVLAATIAFQSALLDSEDSATLVGLAVAGIVTLFAMWWCYFDHDSAHRLSSLRASLIWGYGHYFIFAAAAAVGAGLVVAVEFQQEHAEGISRLLANLATTVPVAIYLVALGYLHAGRGRAPVIAAAFPCAALLVLATSFLPATLYLTAGVMVVLVAVLVLAGQVPSSVSDGNHPAP